MDLSKNEFHPLFSRDSAPDNRFMPTTKLRERGIYALPDKREFIVRQSGRDEYGLYLPKTWKKLEFAEYRLNTEGRILESRVRPLAGASKI